jgi:hypothetical protein
MCKQTWTKDHSICDIELGNNPVMSTSVLIRLSGYSRMSSICRAIRFHSAEFSYIWIQLNSLTQMVVIRLSSP